MKKTLSVLLITFFTSQLTFGQIGYGYTGDKRANIDDWSKMVKEYRNNGQRALDESKFDKCFNEKGYKKDSLHKYKIIAESFVDLSYFLSLILTELGVTTPAEITRLNAASTLISSSNASFFGINTKKPEVGLGVVGTKRFIVSSPIIDSASPL